MMLRTAAALAIALSLVACGRREECRGLTQVIDTQRATVSGEMPSTTPADLAAKAEKYEGVAKAVEGFAVKDAELAKAQKAYVDLMKDQATAARLSREWLMSASSDKEKASKEAAAKIGDRTEVSSYAAVMQLCTH